MHVTAMEQRERLEREQREQRERLEREQREQRETRDRDEIHPASLFEKFPKRERNEEEEELRKQQNEERLRKKEISYKKYVNTGGGALRIYLSKK